MQRSFQPLLVRLLGSRRLQRLCGCRGTLRCIIGRHPWCLSPWRRLGCDGQLLQAASARGPHPTASDAAHITKRPALSSAPPLPIPAPRSAASHGHAQVASALLAKGAQALAFDFKDGLTPAHWRAAFSAPARAGARPFFLSPRGVWLSPLTPSDAAPPPPAGPRGTATPG